MSEIDARSEKEIWHESEQKLKTISSVSSSELESGDNQDV